MQKDFVTSIEKTNEAAVEAVKRLGEIQLRSLERLAEQQLEATSEYMNEGVKQLQILAQSKDLKGLVECQTKYVTGLNERALGHAKRTADILTETKDELSEWFEDGMKVVADTPLAKAVTSKAA